MSNVTLIIRILRLVRAVALDKLGIVRPCFFSSNAKEPYVSAAWAQNLSGNHTNRCRRLWIVVAMAALAMYTLNTRSNSGMHATRGKFVDYYWADKDLVVLTSRLPRDLSEMTLYRIPQGASNPWAALVAGLQRPIADIPSTDQVPGLKDELPLRHPHRAPIGRFELFLHHEVGETNETIFLHDREWNWTRGEGDRVRKVGMSKIPSDLFDPTGALSHDGTKAAFVQYDCNWRDRLDATKIWLQHRCSPSFTSLPGHSLARVWVCDLDGSRPECVGAVDVQPFDDMDSTEGGEFSIMRNLAWSPDDKVLGVLARTTEFGYVFHYFPVAW